MNDEELIRVISDIQRGDIGKAAHIVEMFSEFIYKNSFIDGRLNEDCVQELRAKLITCILKFRFNAEDNILTLM